MSIQETAAGLQAQADRCSGKIESIDFVDEYVAVRGTISATSAQGVDSIIVWIDGEPKPAEMTVGPDREIRFEALGKIVADSADVIAITQPLNALIRVDQSTRFGDGLEQKVARTNEDFTSLFRYDRGLLLGWILHKGQPLDQEVVIAVDGHRLWKGIPRRFSQCGYLGKSMDVHAGLKVQISRPDQPCKTRVIAVTTAEGFHLPGSPLTVNYGDQFAGLVDAPEYNDDFVKISGWCVDIRNPSRVVCIRISTKLGREFQTTTTYGRDEAVVAGHDAPRPGFIFNLPKAALGLTSANQIASDADSFTVFADFSLTPLPVAAVDDSLESSDSVELQLRGTLATDEVKGSIDEVGRTRLRGWARNMRDSNALVVLDLYVDGVLYSTTAARRFRSDLAKHFGDHGCHEFVFEIMPELSWQFPGTFEVVPRLGKNLINHKTRTLQHLVRRDNLRSTVCQDVYLQYRVRRPPGVSSASVAIVVINRDGAELLRSFFDSFVTYNTYQNVEFIIVDHNSTDDSRQVVSGFSERVRVRLFNRDGNYSFSDSNNFGARQTDAEILLFVNNDIRFCADVIAGLVGHCLEPNVGIVGIKLLDDAPVQRSDGLAAIQHLGVYFGSAQAHAVEAFEYRAARPMRNVVGEPIEVPAVTGAFMGCRSAVFQELGGFETSYFYGQEDVDLCLKAQVAGKKIVCANELMAFHARAYSRDRLGPQFNAARIGNKSTLDRRFGFWARESAAESRFRRPGFWTGSVPRIAFVVTEATKDTLAGDYFTALELVEALVEAFPCDCAFLEVLKGESYNLAGYDVVIAMRDDYDPRKIQNPEPHLIKIAWVRNWFDRFLQRPSSCHFDAIWTSSKASVPVFCEAFGPAVEYLPIATNPARFLKGAFAEKFETDYCFTGSYWGKNREIIQMLDPAALPFRCGIFGAGWDAVPHLKPFWMGPMPYQEMPNIYASTKIVIDDANHVTKSWGSVNSRVFDAIAAGALVLTNGALGSADAFGGELPTFGSSQELEDLLWKYLSDEELRLSKVAQLRKLVESEHTYNHRAKSSWDFLNQLSNNQLRISIKIATPNSRVQEEWGDYHFAMGLKYAFNLLGHTVRVDCRDSWYSAEAVGDDVVIVLRGLEQYHPKPHQMNIMWNISHPDAISNVEFLAFDHVFVASEAFTKALAPLLGDKVSALLQCTDHRYFNRERGDSHSNSEILFVGNSRNEFRRIVKDSLELGLSVDVYGTRWDQFIPSQFIKGTHIPNRQLGAVYASAEVVLNDHWASMVDYGFISNRVFDAVASGARVISDRVEGIEAIFGNAVRAYSTIGELQAIVDSLQAGDWKRPSVEESLQVLREHSFVQRASSMLDIVLRNRARRQAILEIF